MPRHSRPERRRIFIGCEGESERSYVRLLQDLCDASDRGLAVHLDSHIIPSTGGNAERILLGAMALIGRNTARRDPYRSHFILLDSDVAVEQRGESFLEDLSRRAMRAGIVLVWQRCCHEALLLHHLPGRERNTHHRSADALRQLESVVPGYRKGWSADRLGRFITLEHVLRAAAVEPDLHALLLEIGLIAQTSS